MSDQAWDLDFGGQTADEVEQQNSSIPDGWYRAKLATVSDDQTSGAKILEFQIVHGPMTGRRFKEWLHNPRFANSQGGIEFAKKKMGAYAKRFGLIDGSA